MARKIIRRRKRSAPRNQAPGGLPSAPAQGGQRPDSEPTQIMVAGQRALQTLIAARLAGEPRFGIASTADNGREAVEKIARERADIAILDINLDQRLYGLATARNLQRIRPATSIIIVTDTLRAEDFTLETVTLYFGSSWSYMHKETLRYAAKMMDFIESVARGVQFIDQELRETLNKFFSVSAERRDLAARLARDEMERGEKPTAARGVRSLNIGDGGRGQSFSGGIEKTKTD